jgi:hypothetical protein
MHLHRIYSHHDTHACSVSWRNRADLASLIQFLNQAQKAKLEKAKIKLEKLKRKRE